MIDLWQYIVVGIVVAVAFALALRSIVRAISHKKSALAACDNCPFKDNCSKSKPTPECGQQS